MKFRAGHRISGMVLGRQVEGGWLAGLEKSALLWGLGEAISSLEF
jgi:hypothetical protein